MAYICKKLPLKHSVEWEGLHRWLSGKESDCQCGSQRRHWFDPWVEKIPWRRKWQPTPVFLPAKSRGYRRLVGYSPWGCKESDMSDDACTHVEWGKRGKKANNFRTVSIPWFHVSEVHLYIIIQMTKSCKICKQTDNDGSLLEEIKVKIGGKFARFSK